jgi:hypothetical protein
LISDVFLWFAASDLVFLALFVDFLRRRDRSA